MPDPHFIAQVAPSVDFSPLYQMVGAACGAGGGSIGAVWVMLRGLRRDVERLEKKVDDINGSVRHDESRLTKLETRCKERHPGGQKPDVSDIR